VARIYRVDRGRVSPAVLPFATFPKRPDLDDLLLEAACKTIATLQDGRGRSRFLNVHK
jgi:hypothetical protein